MAKGLTGIAADLGEARHHIKHCEETMAHQRGVIEKWNEIDQANEKEKAELRTDLDHMRIVRDQALEAEKRAIAARDGVLAQLEQTKKEMADLKARLANLEADNARLKGYIDRVQEMDEAARPAIPVNENSLRSPQPLPRRGAGGDHEVWRAGIDDDANYGSGPSFNTNAQRRRHWTSYGQ